MVISVAISVGSILTSIFSVKAKNQIIDTFQSVFLHFVFGDDSNA